MCTTHIKKYVIEYHSSHIRSFIPHDLITHNFKTTDYTVNAQRVTGIQWWSLMITPQWSIIDFIPPTSKMNPCWSLLHRARSFFLHTVRSMFPQGCAVLQKHHIFCLGCWTCTVEQHPGTTWWHSCPSPLSCCNQSLGMGCGLSVLGNRGRRTCCRFYKLKRNKDLREISWD